MILLRISRLIMSDIEEDVPIAPWVGAATSKKGLSVLVLSSNIQIIDNISDALREAFTRGNFRWNLALLRSFHLNEVLIKSNLIGQVAIDFIVLGVDTSRLFCLEWTKSIYKQIHPDLRNSRRVVLVNASGLPAAGMAVDAGELISVQNDLNLDILTANVYNPDEASFLAQRILKYIEISVGTKTGIPNINV